MPTFHTALTSARKMPFTLAVILLNILAFVFACIQAGATDGPHLTTTLLRLGAQFNPLALDREWYRLFTHVFLHGGIVHLAVNMYVLLFLGYVFEDKVGTKKFAFVYLAAALGSALSGLYWNLFTIGIGAGGPIAGLLGCALVFNIFFSGKSATPMLMLLLHFAGFAATYLLMPELMHADYAAQFGGAITGIVIGFASFAAAPRVAIQKVKVEYLLIMLFAVLYFALPRNQVRYFRFFKQVVAAEDTTSHLLKEKLTDDDMRTFIKNYHHWDDILARLHTQEDLPAALATDTFKLAKYIRLRKQENLYKKMVVQHEAYVYLDSVEYLQEMMKPYRALDYALWSRIKPEPEAELASPRIVKVHYDSDGVETTGPDSAFYRVGFRDSLGRWDGAVRDFYADGRIRMKGVYRRNKRDGVFLYYDDKGLCTEAGRYLDDKRFGKWESFHSNGKRAAEIFYNRGGFTSSLWDSLGNPLVIDGNGREIRQYPNGVIAIEGEYRHGLKEGYWYGRHPDGQMYFEENFSRGVLINGRSVTRSGETFTYDASSLQPIPEGGFDKFHQYVKSEVKKFNSDELGHVKISFRVTRKGALTDISIEQGASPLLEAKAKDILLQGPRWLPARLHGHQYVDGWGSLVIAFY